MVSTRRFLWRLGCLDHFVVHLLGEAQQASHLPLSSSVIASVLLILVDDLVSLLLDEELQSILLGEGDRFGPIGSLNARLTDPLLELHDLINAGKVVHIDVRGGAS